MYKFSNTQLQLFELQIDIIFIIEKLICLQTNQVPTHRKKCLFTLLVYLDENSIIRNVSKIMY